MFIAIGNTIKLCHSHQDMLRQNYAATLNKNYEQFEHIKPSIVLLRTRMSMSKVTSSRAGIIQQPSPSCNRALFPKMSASILSVSVKIHTQRPLAPKLTRTTNERPFRPTSWNIYHWLISETLGNCMTKAALISISALSPIEEPPTELKFITNSTMSILSPAQQALLIFRIRHNVAHIVDAMGKETCLPIMATTPFEVLAQLGLVMQPLMSPLGDHHWVWPNLWNSRFLERLVFNVFRFFAH